MREVHTKIRSCLSKDQLHLKKELLNRQLTFEIIQKTRWQPHKPAKFQWKRDTRIVLKCLQLDLIFKRHVHKPQFSANRFMRYSEPNQKNFWRILNEPNMIVESNLFDISYYIYEIIIRSAKALCKVGTKWTHNRDNETCQQSVETVVNLHELHFNWLRFYRLSDLLDLTNRELISTTWD